MIANTLQVPTVIIVSFGVGLLLLTILVSFLHAVLRKVTIVMELHGDRIQLLESLLLEQAGIAQYEQGYDAPYHMDSLRTDQPYPDSKLI